MFWDYLSQNPESLHQVIILFRDRRLPDDYKLQHGYSSHTFKWVDDQGEFQHVQIHCRQQEAQQTITPEQAETFRYNILNLTKIWPHNEFPLQPVGTLVLDRSPESYFNEIEQVAFAPSHLVPGVEPSADPVLQSRLFSYPDTHIHRLGVNYQQIPVNAPLCPVANFQRGGLMNVLSQGARPNYQSSIAPLAYKNKSVTTTNRETFIGAAIMHIKVFNKDAQDRFLNNVAGDPGGPKNAEIKARQPSVSAAVDQDLSDRPAKALGVSTVKPLAVKPAAEALRLKASCVKGPIAINRAHSNRELQ
ncbi:heme-dependent catalase [Ceratobasidium sp. AG-I]|nr:heme-dependent catalase [Ceratobasidium sp. AG-I]